MGAYASYTGAAGSLSAGGSTTTRALAMWQDSTHVTATIVSQDAGATTVTIAGVGTLTGNLNVNGGQILTTATGLRLPPIASIGAAVNAANALTIATFAAAGTPAVANGLTVAPPTGGTANRAATFTGTIAIVDGTQAAGRLLTSDANGVATWAAPGGGATQWTTNASPTGIYYSGSVGIGSSNVAATQLQVDGTLAKVATSDSTGLSLITQLTPDSGKSAYGLSIANAIDATGLTVAAAYGLYISTPTKVAGTVTAAYGVYINNPTIGGTTNIGLYNAGNAQLMGSIGFGAPPVANIGMKIAGTVVKVSTNSSYAINVSTQLTPDSGQSAYASYTTSAVDATGLTVANSYQMYLDAATKVSGTVTNAYGLYVKAPTIGGTLNTAIGTDGNLSVGGTSTFTGAVTLTAAPILHTIAGLMFSTIDVGVTAFQPTAGAILIGAGLAQPTTLVAAAQHNFVTATNATTYRSATPSQARRDMGTDYLKWSGYQGSGKPVASVTIDKIDVEIAGSISSTPTSGVGMAHFAHAEKGATATTTFTINKNGSSIGTIVFASGGSAGAQSATVTITSSPTALAQGDRLTLTSPAQDSTLAGFGYSLYIDTGAA